jgi:hypothetical protein
MGFGLVNRFIDRSQVVIINNYNNIGDFHTEPSEYISTSVYLVTAPHNGYSSAGSSLDVFW